MHFISISFTVCTIINFELGLESVDHDVEFSDTHQVLSTEYWPNISHVEGSRIIKQAFLSVTTKRKSKAGSKRTFYIGIKRCSMTRMHCLTMISKSWYLCALR